jgi:Phage tail lysozyme
MSPVTRRSHRSWFFAVVPLVSAALVLGCGSASPHEDVGQSALAGTFPNDQTAFDFFVGKGLTPAQAAGIVGNLDQESGDSPTAMQQGGPGMGIAQWSTGGRWDTDSDDNCVWYAAQENESVDSLMLQLQFIWYELQTFSGYGLSELQASTNVTDATIAFETYYEGCGQCDQDNRVTYAQAVLAAFGGDAGVVSTGGGDAGSSADAGYGTCTVTTTGASGVCIDTSSCSSKGGTSTPDYCPGPDNIQCCTGLPASGDVDAGHGDDDSGVGKTREAGDDAFEEPPPMEIDASIVPPSSSGSGASPKIEAGPADHSGGDAGDSSTAGSGGCALSARSASSDVWAGWILPLGLVGLRLGRRARRR